METTLTPKPRLMRMADIIGDVMKDAAEAHEARISGQLRAPITGFDSLDYKIGGSLPKCGPVVILGNTGAGKTAFVTQIAATCGFPAVIVTTEMAPAELFRRQMARVTEQFMGRFKSGEYSPEQVHQYALQTASAMPDLCIIDCTTAYADPSFIRDVLIGMRGDCKSVLLVVDSLHTWGRTSNSGVAEYETVTASMIAVQRICSEVQCPALLVAEQSRAALKDGGGANSGAGSRFIEYGAEIVLDLKADKDEDGAGEKVVAVSIEKNRHGAAGPGVKLSFNGRLQRFSEPSTEERVANAYRSVALKSGTKSNRNIG